MSLFSRAKNFATKQFLDIIKWDDNSTDTLLYKFPMQDDEIQNGGQLVVQEGQVAIFMDKGKIADVFGPGTYKLTTENLPILGDLKGWAFGFKSPFKAEVFFVNTKQFLNQKWGTPQPIWITDPKCQ
jgi:membrane protease subunit (stomatin/prohibitin family)